MSRVSGIISVDSYLSTLKVASTDGSGDMLSAVMTTAQADATSRLSRLSGQQLLAARSEAHQDGGTDSWTSVLSTAIFVLEKGLGTSRTADAEDGQFRRLAELAGEVLERLAEDISSGECGLLSGLRISSVDITPEASIFGGWTGYSIDISFK